MINNKKRLLLSLPTQFMSGGLIKIDTRAVIQSLQEKKTFINFAYMCTAQLTTMNHPTRAFISHQNIARIRALNQSIIFPLWSLGGIDYTWKWIQWAYFQLLITKVVRNVYLDVVDMEIMRDPNLEADIQIFVLYFPFRLSCAHLG